MDGLGYCNIGNLGKNFNTCRIYYRIASFSKYLFIIFDFNSYDRLLKYFSEIKKLSVLSLKFTDNVTYKLPGVVITPYTGNFTLYINSLNMSNVPDNLKNNFNCCYNGFDKNSLFIEVKSLERLLNNFYENYIPYILIYI